MSADADGPLCTPAADIIVTNSSLGAAGDGLSTGDGTSMASAVAGLSLWLRVRCLLRPAPHPGRWRDVSFELEDRDGAHLAGPAAAARFLLERDEGLPEKPRVAPAAAVRFLLERDDWLPEQEKTRVPRFRLGALADQRDQRHQSDA